MTPGACPPGLVPELVDVARGLATAAGDIARRHFRQKVAVDTKNISPVDDVMRTDGLKRRVGAKIPNFASLGPLLANTNFLATLPPITVVDVIDEFDLVALKPPVEIAPMPFRFLWSFRLSNDPGSRWFRNLVIETFSTLQRKAEERLTARWLERAMAAGLEQTTGGL